MRKQDDFQPTPIQMAFMRFVNTLRATLGIACLLLAILCVLVFFPALVMGRLDVALISIVGATLSAWIFVNS